MTDHIIHAQVHQLDDAVQDEAADDDGDNHMHGHHLLVVLPAEDEPPHEQHDVAHEQKHGEGERAVALGGQLTIGIDCLVGTFETSGSHVVIATRINQQA